MSEPDDKTPAADETSADRPEEEWVPQKTDVLGPTSHPPPAPESVAEYRDAIAPRQKAWTRQNRRSRRGRR